MWALRVITVYAAAVVLGLGLDLAARQQVVAKPAREGPAGPAKAGPFVPPSGGPAKGGPDVPGEVLSEYCVTCHNSRLKTAGLMLDTLDVEHVAGHEEVWEKVATKLRTSEMPPPGRPRPDIATYNAITAAISAG